MTTSMQPEGETAALRSRNLRTVAALAGLFLVPLVASFWMYYGGGWQPGGRSNHGELIEPARPLLNVVLPRMEGGAAAVLPSEQWLLVYVAAGSCDQDCRRALYVMRQTRLALGNDMTRVARAMLAPSGCCNKEFLSKEHPGLAVFDASENAAEPLLAQFPENDREHSVYIVDPHGNLMMRHDARRDPKGLLADLKKLLRLSHIG
jgi:hypothetical protein